MKFHTIQSGKAGAETLNVEFAKNDLQINFNGESAGVVQNIYMPSSETININQDFNKHSTTGYSGYISGGPINGQVHVFRHHWGGGSVTPTFVIDSKYDKAESSDAPIVEWEFHLKNTASSGNLTVNSPRVLVGDDPNWFATTTALTDQMYVEPGKTNVYVFRADMFHQGALVAKTLTYSLAYVY